MNAFLKNNFAGILLGALITILIGVGTAYGVIASGVISPCADDPTPPLERWAAKTSLRAYLSSHTPNTTNPLKASSTEDLKAGARLYINNCAFCHGYANGSTSKTANGLYRKPPAIAKEDWSEDADGKVYWFIDKGVKLTAMPSYSKTLSEKEIWQIVLFIKNMRKLPPEVQSYWDEAASHPLVQQ
ncbi:MAG TPA: cytochrome c [Drouetiella sp.]|jgi:thiosulfate dehydrogenase